MHLTFWQHGGERAAKAFRQKKPSTPFSGGWEEGGKEFALWSGAR
jgi:hypothetical protein